MMAAVKTIQLKPLSSILSSKKEETKKNGGKKMTPAQTQQPIPYLGSSIRVQGMVPPQTKKDINS
jgi:hypothetical protein